MFLNLYIYYHHHHVVLIARGPLPLSRHPSLLAITPGHFYRSSFSRLHPMPSQHALLILLLCFVRWEASGNTSAVLRGIALSICSKQCLAFLCSSHLAFSRSILLESRWCSHSGVSTWPQLGRNPVLFYQ